MLDRYREQVQAAIAIRRVDSGPEIARLMLIIPALVTLYISIAVVVVPPSEVREFNFVDERGAVTALSAVFLAMGSGFAFVSFLVSRNHPPRIRVFWLLIAMAVGFLALDELLEFHERIGDRVDALQFSSGPVRHWNDVVVILYGVVAIFGGGLFLPTVVRYPKLLELIGVAFVFYVIHTMIDSLVDPPTTMSVIIEESAKLYCSTFVALALLTGLLSGVRHQGSTSA